MLIYLLGLFLGPSFRLFGQSQVDRAASGGHRRDTTLLAGPIDVVFVGRQMPGRPRRIAHRGFHQAALAFQFLGEFPTPPAIR
jgi:hypothetical protein